MTSQSDPEEGPRVGSLLRASRLRCGEEAADVAEVMHIRLVYIMAIEEGRYDDLPGSAYAIGFIRAYAEHLGLDSEEVVRRFKAETSGLDMSTDLKFLSPIPESGIPRGAILFVGMVVAVLAYGGWYVSSTRDHFLTELIPPLPERLAVLLPSDGATDAKTPSAEPGPDAALAGEAPRSNSAGDGGAPAAATPTAVDSAEPTAIVLPAATSTATAQGDRAAETTPPIAAAPAPEATEITEIPALEETPVTAATPAFPPVPAPSEGVTADSVATESVATDTSMTESIATDIGAADTSMTESVATDTAAADASMTESVATDAVSTEPVATVAAPEPEPALEAVGEIADTPALPPSPPAVAAAVDDLRPTPPPAAPETVASPQATVGREQPDPVEDRVEIAEATPPGAARGEDGDQVAALSEDAGSKPAADAAPPAQEGQSRILVRARMASWIQVRDDVGKQLLMTRLMRAGDTFNVPDRPGLTLLTGNAGALEILVDGETVPPLGPVGAVRRDVTLDIERLRQGTAAVE
ncbi:MAG: DUF4115 domain-containing protein [Rhodospirillales bacterium]|nr:DUF4115 domain-containing protein [Rhodospirillales bacterium]